MGESLNQEHKKVVVGTKFGKLTTIKRLTTKKGYGKWLCACDCGNTVEVYESHLKTGHTKSCGCLKTKYVNLYGKDLTGKRFTNLVVISKDKPRNKHSYWICKCDCGNTISVMDSHLKTGHTKSCGCKKSELLKTRANNLVGKEFGRLKVLEPIKDGYWKCKCSCGNICTVYKENLTGGDTKSCGCLQEETRKKNMKKAIHFVDGTCVERIASNKLFSNNSTGYTGVYHLSNGKYRACIGFKNKRYSLGTYYDIEEAVKVRKKKEQELFGTFLDEYYKTTNA